MKKSATIDVKESLKTLAVNDTVQFKAAGGGIPILMKVEKIVLNKRDKELPRLFIGAPNRFSGKQHMCTEDQVLRVITQSVDDPADWEEEKKED